jgi:putative hemolysin
MFEQVQLVAIAVLLGLSFIFSGSEVSILSISELERLKLAREKSTKLQVLLHYLRHPQKALITILIGNMVVNTSAAIVGEQLSGSVFADNQLLYSVFIMTFLILLFGEIIPKNVAALKPITFSRIFIPIINIANRLFFPLIFLIQRMLRKSSGYRKKLALSKDELLSAVESGSDAGIHDVSIEVLRNMIHLISKPISDIMIPRSEIQGIDINDYWRNMALFMKSASVSTVLLYEENMDQPLGYLKVTDFVTMRKKDITQYVRKPLYIPENKHILPLLSEFKESGHYMAIVLDEYGGTAGLVTLKDILDAIFIKDMLLTLHIQRTGDATWEIDGNTKISDVNFTFDLNLPTESNTIGGYIVNVLGRIPEVGTSIMIDDRYEASVVRGDQRQIESLEFVKRAH